MPDTELMEAFCDNQYRILQHSRIDSPPPEPQSPLLAEPSRRCVALGRRAGS